MSVKEVKRILVPVDLSESAPEVLDYAQMLQKSMGAELVALHVFDERFLGTLHSINSPVLGNLKLDFHKKGKEELDKICQGREISQRVFVEGHPAKKAVSYAEENNIDLVVMGTHGYTGLDKFVLGSIAEYVVRHSPCPVLTVRTSPK